jgi:hypothetical protein
VARQGNNPKRRIIAADSIDREALDLLLRACNISGAPITSDILAIMGFILRAIRGLGNQSVMLDVNYY